MEYQWPYGGNSMKEIMIKLTKCILILTEQELIKGLPDDLFIKGLKRGKAYQRQERVKKYEEKRRYENDLRSSSSI